SMRAVSGDASSISSVCGFNGASIFNRDHWRRSRSSQASRLAGCCSLAASPLASLGTPARLLSTLCRSGRSAGRPACLPRRGRRSLRPSRSFPLRRKRRLFERSDDLSRELTKRVIRLLCALIGDTKVDLGLLESATECAVQVASFDVRKELSHRLLCSCERS